MNSHYQAHAAAFFSVIADLNRMTFGRFLLGDAARKHLDKAVFNVEVNPNAIAVIAFYSEADFLQAVRRAAEHTVPVLVLSGGHDQRGHAFESTFMSCV